MELVRVPGATFRCRNLVAGEWRDPVGGETRELVSPYTGEVFATVPLSSARDVDAAVTAARAAFEGWGRTPIKERTQTLFRYREILLRDLDVLSHAAALEAGKTVDEAKAGILKGIEVIEFALSLQNLDDGAMLEVSRGVTCEVRREPLGVVAGITPFNFPAMVPMWLYPIAITVGNCFVLKPSEKVPVTACLQGERMLEAGFPAGVFSIVHGGREAVEALVDHPDVRALGFVGSSAIANAVFTRAAQQGKRALCLGGAKNVLMVVPDADPEVTIPGVVASFTGCAGQRCMAASLLVAVGEVDRVIEGIVTRAASMRLGPDMGALIDGAARDRIERDIARALEQGATLLLDGRRPKAPEGYEKGAWMAPTILDSASAEMECASKEIFGPVLTIVRVKTLEEALRIEASLGYGNACSVFTTRGAVARHVAERATSGMIGVNVGVPVPREPFSFGGTKSSRFGVGDITGRQGVEHWTSLKKITTKWQLADDSSWMS
ncbi:MAG: CoA-acylating methylmalonate-semialdehyde dehydrogenase [Myxococcota bacterium]|nr:CoA-acylating methylmalonate-semialdehyde dehydrogenase [Myxococcota bacterium]